MGVRPPGQVPADQPDNTEQVSTIGRGDHDKMILWPDTQYESGMGDGIENFPNNPFQLDTQSLMASLRPGTTEFDFETGTVTHPNGETESLSQSLNNMEDSDWVRALYVRADDHIIWRVDDQDSARFMYDQRADKMTRTKTKKLYIFSFEPTHANVFASTDDRLPVEPNGMNRASVKTTYRLDGELKPPDQSDIGYELPPDYTAPDPPNNGDARYIVNGSWTTLEWTTEWDTVKEQPMMSPNWHGMNATQVGVNFNVYGETEAVIDGTWDSYQDTYSDSETEMRGGDPVEINMRTIHTETPIGYARRLEQWSDFKEFGDSGTIVVYPQSYSGNMPSDTSNWYESPQMFEFDHFPHHYVMTRARSVTVDTEGNVSTGGEGIVMAATTFLHS